MTVDQLKRFRNKNVQMIYFSKSGACTKRQLRVLGVSDMQIYAYCYLRKQPRKFLIDRVLAIHPYYEEKRNM